MTIVLRESIYGTFDALFLDDEYAGYIDYDHEYIKLKASYRGLVNIEDLATDLALEECEHHGADFELVLNDILKFRLLFEEDDDRLFFEIDDEED